MLRTTKSIPLACALACFGIAAAHAQSSVTIYGLADGGVEYSKSGTSLTRVISGGGAGSRLGFRGTEDLGGGLSAVFKLEEGINMDTGALAQNGRAFGRESSVGLSSRQWGSVHAGRLPTPYYSVLGGIDAFGFLGNGGILTLTRTGSGGQQLLPLGVEARNDNSIGYVSPVWGGVEARALYTWGESSTTGNGNGNGASLRYSANALDLVAGYTKVQAPSGAIGSIRGVVLGGNYDFKVAKVFAGYADERNSCSACASNFARPGGISGGNAADFRLLTLGVRVPLGAFTAIAQFARVTDRSHYDVDPGKRDANWLSIGSEYALSRRTILYTSIGTISNQNGSLYALGSGPVQQAAGRVAAGNPRSTTLALGVRHVF
jgi:predicted porin